MASARPRIDDDLLSLSRTEWLNIINEYIKDKDNRIIAIKYYLDGVPQEDIGMELNMARSTVRDRLYYKILPIIEKYAKKKS